MPPLEPARTPHNSFLGNYFALRRDRLAYFQGLAQLGPVVSMPIFGRRFFFVNDVDLIGQIFTDQSDVMIKAEVLRRVKRLLGEGLLTSENPLWRRQRKLVAHAFTPKRMVTYTTLMHRAAQQSLTRWKPDTEIDIHEAMSQLTLDIVAKALFSSDVIDSAPQVAEALGIFTRFFTEYLQRIIPPPQWWPSHANREAKRAVQMLDEIIANIIAERRNNPGEHGDLLDAMLHAQDDESKAMSDKQLRDECVTLFLAGHETTALTLAHTLYLLANSPECDARLAQEVSSATFHDPVTVEDLMQLRYTDAVLRESMRLYPPGWIMARETTADIMLGDYAIPKGSTLMFSQFTTHRNPSYFSDPLAFKPERWLDPAIRQLPKFAYFPFGGGPRVCIGNHFAMTEAAIILSTLLQRYRFSIVPGEQLLLQPSITLRTERGLRMRVHTREHNAAPTDYASSKCLQNTSGAEAS